MDLEIGDVVRLRKKHPCGSHEWQVVRLGADIGIRCRGCNRRVLVERGVLERRATAVFKAPLQAGTCTSAHADKDSNCCSQ